MKNSFAKLGSLCIAVVAALLVFILANYLVAAISALVTSTGNDTVKYAPIEPNIIQPLYPDLTGGALKQKLARNKGQGISYRGYVETQNEPGFTGRYLVHDQGFRVNPGNIGTWPPAEDALTIFVFGGNATLGPNLSDNSTIPSALREIIVQQSSDLPVYVYNFASYGHISTQQRLFFETLLISGYIPDIALFFGINEDLKLIGGEPYFNELITKHFRNQALLWQKLPISYLAAEAFQKLPLVQAVKNGISRQEPSVTNVPLKPSPDITDDKITRVVDRYIENTKSIKAVAKKFNVVSAFIMMPIPEPANSAIHKDVLSKLNTYDVFQSSSWIDCTNSRTLFDQSITKMYRDDGLLTARAALEIALCSYENLRMDFPDLSALN